MKSKEAENISENERKNRNSVWEILVQVYEEFANESTVHGIKYTAQAKTSLERLMWLVIVIISILFAGGLANKFYERHESGNMRTTVVSDQFPSFKFAIPSVTLCHGNIVSAERLLHFLNTRKLRFPVGLTVSDFERGLLHLHELIYPFNYYPERMGNLQRILDENRISVIELLKELSPKCMDKLIMCVYEGRTQPCEELFVPRITSYGICCSFNSAEDTQLEPSRNTSTSDDLHSFNFGTRYFLSVLLKSYNESDGMAMITYSGGYKVLMQDKYTTPGLHSVNFMLASTFETIVGLNGKFLTTTPEVLALASQQRKCRPSTKKKLYRLDNCYENCRKAIIRNRCKCVHYFVHEVDPNETVCNLTHIPCLAKVIPDTYSLKLHKLCDCLPDCEGTDYTISITGQPFNAVKFRPGKFYKKAQKYPNATALHITFASQTSILERKELILSWINLVSSLGGVFNLFLGCSFISIFEFIYFFFFRFIQKIRIKYKRNAAFNVN